jgi:hypothetical protein
MQSRNLVVFAHCMQSRNLVRNPYACSLLVPSYVHRFRAHSLTFLCGLLQLPNVNSIVHGWTAKLLWVYHARRSINATTCHIHPHNRPRTNHTHSVCIPVISLDAQVLNWRRQQQQLGSQYEDVSSRGTGRLGRRLGRPRWCV